MPNDSNAPATDTTAQTTQGQPAQGDPQPGQQATPPAEGQQQSQPSQAGTEGQQGQDQSKAGENAQTDGKTQGAPEQYADFATPEGVALDAAVVTDFKEVAKDIGLSQENAQKVIDKLAPTIAKQQTQALNEMTERASTEWAQAAAADAELVAGNGTDSAANFQENLAVAKKAWETYGTPELQKLLNDSRLGNHPEMIRWAYRVGKTLQQDNQHVQGGKAAAPIDPAKRLFPNQA